MGKVHLVELLCPLRHCLLGGAYVEGEETREQAIEHIEGLLVPRGPFNRHCAICGSADLTYDDQQLPFNTLMEAAPFLATKAQADAQMRSKLEALRNTYDQALRAGQNN